MTYDFRKAETALELGEKTFAIVNKVTSEEKRFSVRGH